MQTYEQIKNTNTYQTDNNSCTVVASAIAFNTDYKEMTEYYRANGRRRGRGIQHTHAVKLVVRLSEEKGLEYKRMNKTDIVHLTRGKTMTVNNCTKYLDSSKNYVMFSRGHAIGVRQGKVEDWTKGSKRPVVEMIEITPKQEKVFDSRKLIDQQQKQLLEMAKGLLCK